MYSLTDYLTSLGPWNWIILSVLLFVLEMIVPGVHFVWFGMAATVVGVLALSIGIPWQLQLVLFGIIAMAMVFFVRRFATPGAAPSDQPDLNMRANYYIGRTVVVADPITNGRGRVKVGDSLWMAEGPDLPVGTRAKVVGANGTALVVEPL